MSWIDVRLLVASIALASGSCIPIAGTQSPPEPFAAAVLAIDDATAARMTSSWRPGCPVALEDLRLVTVTHWGFDTNTHAGELVVHADVADDIATIFRALYDTRFPIERMDLVDVFAGDDDRSMTANNTSAFNCRFVAGTSRWSEHAYGRAIDINPLINPYVQTNGRVDPPAGAPYADRTQRPGLIAADDAAVTAFAEAGWQWGGNWSKSKDYQHFSRSGN